MMKRGVFILLAAAMSLFLIAMITTSSALDCTFLPKCEPNSTSCGCGGMKYRHVLCEGGCSAWGSCSVSETESACGDSTDNDCDGTIDCADSDCASDFSCIDSDGDSYPSSIDCDDSRPGAHPGATELCNARDDDCDGEIDESLSRQCGTTDLGVCMYGTETCVMGSWRRCDAILPTSESCDSIDNDCDGQVDEGCECTIGSSRPCGTETGSCSLGTQTCAGGSWSECAGAILPVEELCGNSFDDDCDGVVDEDCIPEGEPAAPVAPVSTPADNSTEDFPPPASPLTATAPDIPSATSPTTDPVSAAPRKDTCVDADGDGYGVYCALGFDCDDSDAAINPGATELCNSVDDNCNNIVDDGLSRVCGVSNVGICTFGTERCTQGDWTGCDAIFPSEELCDNDIDDNCNTETDEECDSILTGEEQSLLQFLDMKFGKDSYDRGYYLGRHKQTKKFVVVQKSSKIESGKTKITIKLNPIKTLHNLTIFEHIPKFIASSADKIVFAEQPEIIQADPLVAWHFDELSESVDISYEVPGEIERASEKTSTITLAEESSPIVRPWFFDFIPLLFIPILGFIFVVLVQIAHRRRAER